MTRYVEVIYLDGPPCLTSIDDRTPNKVNGYGNIDDLVQRGYTVTPLIALTPQRVAALQVVKNALSIFGDTKRLLAVQEINAMLAEAEGENNE
jgi:hypothetical protein